MRLAATVSSKSKDNSTRVGAVIADQAHRVRTLGFNGFPQGVCDDIVAYVKRYPTAKIEYVIETMAARHERPGKYLWNEHAERNAIYSAARVGTAIGGCIIYINGLPPCTDCARAIIQSGIVEVAYLDVEIPERWKSNLDEARNMLLEANVVMRPIYKELQ